MSGPYFEVQSHDANGRRWYVRTDSREGAYEYAAKWRAQGRLNIQAIQLLDNAASPDFNSSSISWTDMRASEAAMTPSSMDASL